MKDIAERMAAECLAVRVRRLDRVVTRIYNDALRPFGVTIAQGNLLVAIAKIGGAPAQLLGRVLDLEKSTLSRNLKLLADAGWITRGAAITITPAGRKLLERSYPAWEGAQTQVKALLGADGAASLERMAAALRGA